MATLIKEEINQKHNRFKDFPWYKAENPPVVLIGGAGGIGSWTAFLLTRAGFHTVVYDFDTLEEHNLGGQLFSKQDIGDNKAEALEKLVKSFHDGQLIPVKEKMTSDSPTHSFVIAAFDNMIARKELFMNWVEAYAGPKSEAIFIDGTLTGELLQIYCVRGFDQDAIQMYMERLETTDAEIEEAPCTRKQTSHSAAMIASLITGFFTNHITNLYSNDHTERNVPKFFEFFIPLSAITT